MSAYVVIKTLVDTYKCHDFRLKNSRVYFNGRAVNLGNVVSITAKDGSTAYSNDELTVVKQRTKNAHHVSTLKGADKCKAAVKAGDVLTHEQMHQLIKDLAITKNRFACPHGRPTGWLLSLHDIEKKFKRKL